MHQIGDIIDSRWQIVEELSHDSGQGNTYLVEDMEDPKGLERYVIKLLKIHDPKAVARFEQEINASLTLKHRNIIKVVAYAYKNTPVPYLVTQYCSGRDLTAEKIKDLKLIERLRMFESICEAIAHAHSQEVIHRDIKPGNIFLESPESLIPIVGDFGLCFFKDDEETERQTAMSESMGNWQFGPPERIRREDHPSGSFDVYQLGKLLYWLLSKGVILYREYQDRDPFELRKKDSAHAIYRAYEILAKSVKELPADRYFDAGRMLDDVKNLVVFAENDGRYLDCELPQVCVFCRVGTYKWTLVPRINAGTFNYQASRFYGLTFGLDAHDTNVSTYPRILFGACRRCGNIQQFRLDQEMHLSSDWQNLPSSE